MQMWLMLAFDFGDEFFSEVQSVVKYHAADYRENQTVIENGHPINNLIRLG